MLIYSTDTWLEEKLDKKIFVWWNAHLWYVTIILIALTVFYYIPSLISFMGGKAPNWVIFNMPHDLHRASFFIPMLYAAYKFRVKGVIVIALISMLIFLPRALFISPYPFSLIRSIVFIVGLWFSGLFIVMALNTIRKQAEEALRESKKTLSEIIQESLIPIFVINKWEPGRKVIRLINELYCKRWIEYDLSDRLNP